MPLTANFTSSNTEGIDFIVNVQKGILFFNFCKKVTYFARKLSVEICFIIQMKLNCIEIKHLLKLVKFIF